VIKIITCYSEVYIFQYIDLANWPNVWRRHTFWDAFDSFLDQELISILLIIFVRVLRVTTCLENLEMSGNLKHVSEMSGILLTVWELSGKNLVKEKCPKTSQLLYNDYEG